MRFLICDLRLGLLLLCLAAAPVNVVSNGDFESALTGPWSATANFTNSYISTSVSHSGAGSLKLIGTAGGVIFALLGAILLLYLYRRFVQHRPLTGPGARRP